MRLFKRIVLLFGIAILLPSMVAAAGGERTTCMVRPLGGDQDRPPLAIVVTSDQMETYAKRGFVEESCGDRLVKKVEYERQICLLAQASEAARSGFEKIYGVSPKELCDMVRESPEG